MTPNQYIATDNALSLSIQRTRNAGNLTYSLTLKTDINKELEGADLITSLDLIDYDANSLFSNDVDNLQLHNGLTISGEP